MDSTSGLRALLDRARAEDPAARERAFGEVLRLLMIFVRGKMGPGLRSRHESADICQSIAKSFVEDHGAGKVRFDSEAALVGYLRDVVRTKLAEVARRDGALKRAMFEGVALGGGGGEGASWSVIEPAGDEPTGEDVVLRAEMIERFADRLSPMEAMMLRLRAAGQDWSQVGAAIGVSGATARQQYSRLVRRLTDEGAGETGS
ncbi:MAG: RNA polymerase sigma factor [Phycisphaerales bacterium]